MLSALWVALATTAAPRPLPPHSLRLEYLGAPPSDAAGRSVVWNEENLLQNEAERPEGGYMKIDEPVFVTMRDGVRIACRVYRPDAAGSRLIDNNGNGSVERTGNDPLRFFPES